jgi:hypothetical protein
MATNGNISNDENSSIMNNPFMSLLYWEKSGCHYKAGVPVVCNDFNGPSNSSHIYYSKWKHPFLAYKYYKSNDCY